MQPATYAWLLLGQTRPSTWPLNALTQNDPLTQIPPPHLVSYTLLHHAQKAELIKS